MRGKMEKHRLWGEGERERKNEGQEVINQLQEPNITKVCVGRGAASFPPFVLFPLFCTSLHF